MSPHPVTRRLLGALALASLALASGCANTVTQAYLHRSGVPNSFAYAAGGRDMAVVVSGNPFAAPQAELNRVVVDAMQGRNQGPQTHFTLAPGETARPGYRILVALNPPVSFSAQNACGPSGIPTVPATDTVRALMVFCAKDTILSEVSGRVPATARPLDGDFVALIGAMTRELIPIEDPDTDDNNELLIRR